MDKQPAGIFNNEPEPIKSILDRVIENLEKQIKSSGENNK